MPWWQDECSNEPPGSTKRWEFLEWGPVGFSRRTMLHGARLLVRCTCGGYQTTHNMFIFGIDLGRMGATNNFNGLSWGKRTYKPSVGGPTVRATIALSRLRSRTFCHIPMTRRDDILRNCTHVSEEPAASIFRAEVTRVLPEHWYSLPNYPALHPPVYSTARQSASNQQQVQYPTNSPKICKRPYVMAPEHKTAVFMPEPTSPFS
jgi:hypothetical protein